jgi:hypothetical protein
MGHDLLWSEVFRAYRNKRTRQRFVPRTHPPDQESMSDPAASALLGRSRERRVK